MDLVSLARLSRQGESLVPAVAAKAPSYLPGGPYGPAVAITSTSITRSCALTHVSGTSGHVNRPANMHHACSSGSAMTHIGWDGTVSACPLRSVPVLADGGLAPHSACDGRRVPGAAREPPSKVIAPCGTDPADFLAGCGHQHPELACPETADDGAVGRTTRVWISPTYHVRHCRGSYLVSRTSRGGPTTSVGAPATSRRRLASCSRSYPVDVSNALTDRGAGM